MNPNNAIERFHFDRARPLDAVRRRLVDLAEPAYQAFVSKLLPDVDDLLGVRVPTLRSLARKIAQDCGSEFLNAVFHLPAFELSGKTSPRNRVNQRCFKSYEERLIVGLVLAETRLDFDSRLDAIAAFVPFLESWGDCDVFSASLRVPKDRRAEFWEFLD
ncbi:MAG: hypothetical protein IJE97_02575, partial [Thermoguttaceae bacterium]|nr:hypothetical protein [Thermoguttaceae bacterium]